MAVLTLSTGYPNRYVVALGSEDAVSKNDVPVRITSDVDVTGLTLEDITVTGADRISLKAYSARVYEVMVRPPATGTGTYTVEIGQNAVTEGNAAVSQTFNYHDTPIKTTLFNYRTALPGITIGEGAGSQNGPVAGVQVEGSRVYLLAKVSGTGNGIYALTRTGTRKSNEDFIFSSFMISTSTFNITSRAVRLYLVRVNDRRFIFHHYQDASQYRRDIYRNLIFENENYRGFVATEFGFTNADFVTSGVLNNLDTFHAVDINRWGIFFVNQSQGVYAQDFNGQRQEISDVILLPGAYARKDRVYSVSDVYEAVDAKTGELLRNENLLNVRSGVFQDVCQYADKIYITGLSSDPQLYEIDLPKYQTPEVRKYLLPYTLYPGDRLDLKPLATGAVKFGFEADYDVPSYFSIDSQNRLVVAATGTPMKDTPIFVKIRAYSYRGDTPLHFYVYVRRQRAPQLAYRESQKTLYLTPGESYDLRRLIANREPRTADLTFAFRTGFRIPTDVSLSGYNLTLASTATTVPGALQLQATNNTGTTEFDVNIVVQRRISEQATAYRLLIEGIDVSDDIASEFIPSVNHELDTLRPYEYIAGDMHFDLSSDRGKYEGKVSGNFWETENIANNGFLANIELWQDSESVSRLIFKGRIRDIDNSFEDITARLLCINEVTFLKNLDVLTAGVPKVSAVAISETETIEQNYPLVEHTDYAVRESIKVFDPNCDELVLTKVKNSPELHYGGERPIAYLDGDNIKVYDCPATDPIFVTLNGEYRYRHIRTFFEALAAVDGDFSARVAIPEFPEMSEGFFSSRGNVTYNTENTKITRTVVDWLYDATDKQFWYLLSHPSSAIQDYLAVYDEATDRYTVEKVFDIGVQVCQLASSDFDTFCILATEATDFDFAEGPTPNNYNAGVFDKLDSSREMQQTQVLKHVVSTDTTTALIANTITSLRPQIGLHYWAGFENERHIRWREGVFFEARTGFEIRGGNLYYRYADWNQFGVARVAVAGGTPAALITRNRVPSDVDSESNFFNTLNFDFDIDANGDIYCVSVSPEYTASSLELTIWENTSPARSGTVTYKQTFSELTVIDDSGGAFLGVHEVKVFNGKVYAVVEIGHLSDGLVAGTRKRDIKTTAGAVLYAYDLAGQWDVVKKYDYVMQACRSLTVHQNTLYFIEQTDAATHYSPSNVNLPNWDANTRANTVKLNPVFLWKVVGTTVSRVMSPWFDEKYFTSTAVRMLSVGENLHIIGRYADKYAISAPGSDASKPENEQWLVYGHKIQPFLEKLSGSVYQQMLDIAKVVEGSLQFNPNAEITPISPSMGYLKTALTDAATSLELISGGEAFGASGVVLIDTEAITWTGRTGNVLTGLTRGVSGTKVDAHTQGVAVLKIDNIFEDTDYSNIGIKTETDKFFNVVRDNQQSAEVSDMESIATNGEQALVLDTPLSNHQSAWKRFLYGKMLNRLKTIRSRLETDLDLDANVALGDILCFAFAGKITFPVRVMSAKNQRNVLSITGEQVVLPARRGFPIGARISDQMWTEGTAIRPFTLPRAEGYDAVNARQETYAYRAEGLPEGVRVDAETLQVSGTPVAVQSASAVRWIVTDTADPTWSDILSFDATVQAGTLRWTGTQENIIVGTGETFSRELVRARGGVGRQSYSLSGNPAETTFQRILPKIAGELSASGTHALTLNATDENSASLTAQFNLNAVLNNRLVLGVGRSLRLYDLEGAYDQSMSNVAPSGYTEPMALTATNERFVGYWLRLNPQRRDFIVMDREFNRVSAEEVLPQFTTEQVRTIARFGDFWIINKPTSPYDEIHFYNASTGVQDTTKTINVGSAVYGLITTPTEIIAIVNAKFRVYREDGVLIKDVSLPSGKFNFSTSNHGFGRTLEGYVGMNVRTPGGAVEADFHFFDEAFAFQKTVTDTSVSYFVRGLAALVLNT